jgi:hypothetical protein
MSDEKGAAGSAQRLTELAQRLNQLNATRFTAMAAENPTQLPPHLVEVLSTKPTNGTSSSAPAASK